MAEIHRYKAEVKFQQIFVCSTCQAKGIGDTITGTVEGSRLTTLLDLRDTPLSASNMPIGWAHSYDTGFQCPKCVRG